MEPTFNFLCNLYNLLFLQGLGDLNQFRGVSAHDGLVHVARIAQAHDDVPARLLGKHPEGLGLRHLLCHLVGVVPVGHAQQQSLLIALQVPHLQVSGRGHQRTVVVIHRIAQRIVVRIDLAARLQQLHLVRETTLLKHADSLLGGGLRATEGHVHVDDFLHPLLDLHHVLVGQHTAVLLLEVAVVAPAERVLNEQFRGGKHVLRGFVEHKAQRTHIHAVSAALASIQKLHVTILVQTEFQSL